MALAVVTSGTTAALTVGGPETSLTTQTPGSPLTYVARIDTAALAAGEFLDILVYTKTLAAGTERLEWADQANGDMLAKAVLVPPIPTDVSYRIALLQRNGAGRTFPWKVFSL